MTFWEPSNVVDVVTAIGILAGVGTLYATMRLRKTTFALEYVKRFWDIDDDLRACIARDDAQGRMLQMERYLTLCEDEFELAELGFVDSRTWPVWHAGIRAVSLGRLCDDVAMIRSERPEDFALLATCLDATGAHRAWLCPAVHRAGRRGRRLTRAALSLSEPVREQGHGRLAPRREHKNRVEE